MSDHEDNVLIRRCIEDQRAFETLIKKYEKKVYSICLNILHEPAASEDSAQEAFVKAYFALPEFDQARKFSNWLFKIATNLCRNRLRKKKVEQKALRGVYKRKQKNTQADRHGENLLSVVNERIRRLPPKLSTAMLLFHKEELSLVEVADVMAVPVGTVKTYLYEARKQVRQAIEAG